MKGHACTNLALHLENFSLSGHDNLMGCAQPSAVASHTLPSLSILFVFIEDEMNDVLRLLWGRILDCRLRKDSQSHN